MKPLDALNELLENQIMVKLKNGIEIQGKLKAFDIHINLVLEDAEIKEGEVTKKFPRLFVRGDMILFVA
ncbi:MAG: LSm family protein [Candidatus Altiarchaeota archaeon]|nr:LSm family protein [Candidatus Altiarchaeota archaeon]